MNSSKGRFSFVHSRLVKSLIFSGAVLLILAFILLRYEGFFAALSTLFQVLRPPIIGVVLAFILNTPFSLLEQRLLWVTERLSPKKKPMPRLAYWLGLVLTYLFAAAVVAAIVCIIIPQFADSIRQFAANFDTYYENVEQLLLSHKDMAVFDWLQQWGIEEKLMGLTEYLPEMLLKTFDFTASLFGVVVDLFVGIAFSVYILADKRGLKKMAQGLAKLALKQPRYSRFAGAMKLTVDTFSSFVNGQLTEAFILGVLCYIGMKVFRFDYAVLISVIIGITNMIPIVGPIAGTIPCALVLLLASPRQAVWFVLFVIVLQQLESNLIYPRVVGSSVGLPPLWVLLAVVLGGGLGGILGMILGIPVLSLVYTYLQNRLRELEPEEAPKPVPGKPAPAAKPTPEASGKQTKK
ncbi:AI-2E family transporter [Ruminococcus sp.]|uniref:AI-2E family transporter n=1 Tax=Ruminococcus sp. TaxID=41978 RepID=UPI003F0DA692